MGLTYEQLEHHLTGSAAVPREVAERIDRLARGSAHERTMPPSPD